MNETDSIRFEGKDASEAEEFIRSVNVRAFNADKWKDDGWTAMLAGTAFTGQALRWYRSLSPAVRDSWDALQNALLSHFQPSSAASTSAPTPSVAGPPPRDIISSSQSPTGRIRVVLQSNVFGAAYLCGDLSEYGVYTWTQDVSRALSVKHSPESHMLEVLDGDAVKSYIGAQFWNQSAGSSQLGREGKGYLEVTQVRKTSPGYTSSLKYGNGRPVTGEIIVDLWNVGSDGALLPLMWQDGVRYCLEACVFIDTKGLALTSDFATFSKHWNPNQVERLQLLFEPL